MSKASDQTRATLAHKQLPSLTEYLVNSLHHNSVQLSEDSIEGIFVGLRMTIEAREYAKGGEAYIKRRVIPERLSEFGELVAKLQKLGCQRDVLYRCLYSFGRANEAHYKHGVPYKAEIDAAVISIGDVLRKIDRLERSVGFALRGSPSGGTFRSDHAARRSGGRMP